MDVTPQALRAVTFREKLRGYHPEDVDEFLERVADGVAVLQARLDESQARLAVVEAELAQRAAAKPEDNEDAVKRTLVLAQRTSDMAIKEAREEATRLVAEAQATAERTAEDAQRQLRVDIDALGSARAQLEADANAMQQYVEQERARLLGALGELHQRVEAAGRRTTAPPAAARAEIPPQPRRAAPPPQPKPAPAPAPAAPPPPVAEVQFEPPESAKAAPEEAEAPPGPPAAPAATTPVPPPPRVPPVTVDAPRREPVPPPVASQPIVAARPPSGRPSGPPPGPRRLAAAYEDVLPEAQQAAESLADTGEPTDEQPAVSSALRRRFRH